MRARALKFVVWSTAVSLSIPVTFAQSESDHTSAITLARGAGTTIIEGGTGKSGGFLPVETTIAFHAERTSGSGIAGDFECLARTPETPAGSGSGRFTVNVMYVTGQIKTVVLSGESATLSGTADITGLGAGVNVPFTLVVTRGGPGAIAQLTTNGTPELVFHEILLQGKFDIFSRRHEDR
jgi:hypothetical protein